MNETDFLAVWAGLAMIGLGTYLNLVTTPPSLAEGRPASPARALGGAALLLGILWLVFYFTTLIPPR